MNFSEIWGEVANNFPTSAQTRVKTAVNAAYHEIMSARQWSWREVSTVAVALVAGTARYALTGTSPVVTDFDGMISVNLELTLNQAKRELWEIGPQEFDQVFGHVYSNSQPAVWCVQGGAAATTSGTMVAGGQTVLAISPPPLATAGNGVNLFLRYFRSVASVELVANGDIPIMPVSMHYALVLGGNAYMAEALGNPNKAQQWRQLFEKRLSEAMRNDEGLRLRNPRLLVPKQDVSIYPITGQTPQTYDPSTRPYDR